MLIRELEKETGLERATIRFYEKEGLITPSRSENSYRTYSAEDCQTLLKIKLLRQLGMSLEKIKQLQQGNADFSALLGEQIMILERQIQDSTRAKEVCVEIRNQGVDYSHLDARYYLDALTKPSVTWKPQPVPEFHRTVPVHPWRRYFARRIDLLIVRILILFLFTVLLRIRPVNSLLYTLIGFEVVAHLVLIPLEGLMLFRWGTTPGKWIMGIRVESVNGGNLSLSVALVRAWAVLKDGFGYTIPLYGLWTQYQAYREYKEDGAVCWDVEYEAEMQFEEQYSLRKKLLIAVTAAAIVFTALFAVNDGIRPVHRGSKLTVAQFAENYNDWIEMSAAANKLPVYESDLLTPEGKWGTAEADPWSENVIFIGTEMISNPEPEFVTENGAVHSIIYRVGYQNVLALEVFETQPMYLVVTAALGQDWMSIFSFADFWDQFTAACQAEDGRFLYENLEIIWDTEATNCTYNGALFFSTDSKNVSTLDLTVEIRIHEYQ